MTIMSAALELNAVQWTSHDQENLSEMPWALNLPVADHGITNLLLRSAVSLPNGTIVVIATGTKTGMPAELGGILLHFSV